MQSSVHLPANRPDPDLEYAEREAYQEELRAIAMTAWPAGVPADGNACIVELRLTPPGTVLDANVLEPCTLDEAQREHGAKLVSLAPGVIDTGMQAEIRQSDVALFPNKQRFIELNESGSLASPHATGEQIVSYLLAPNFGMHAVDDLRSN